MKQLLIFAAATAFSILVFFGLINLFAEPIDGGYFTNKAFFIICCLCPYAVQILNFILMRKFFKDFKKASLFSRVILWVPIFWLPFAITMWAVSCFAKNE